MLKLLPMLCCIWLIFLETLDVYFSECCQCVDISALKLFPSRCCSIYFSHARLCHPSKTMTSCEARHLIPHTFYSCLLVIGSALVSRGWDSAANIHCDEISARNATKCTLFVRETLFETSRSLRATFF